MTMRPKCREKVDAGLMHPPLNNANKARLDRSVGVEGRATDSVGHRY